MRLLKFLLSNQLKCSNAKNKIGGFTLIELLVGLLLAVLVITPLLGFMINILDNDRKEQAKANSEQEIKSALDYIARDLQQAVYIYDAEGIQEIRDQLPEYSQKSKYFPVLVFWKRQYIPKGFVVKKKNADNKTYTIVGNDDTYVYSLVAYYVIKDDNATWSKAARIGRFQISNGYGEKANEINDTRDPGFQMFNLNTEGTLKTKMNQWTKKSDETYKQDILPLVDYIDQTKISATNEEPKCSNGQSLVPKYTGSGDAVVTDTDNVRVRGFYVCVDSDKNVAEVYLRGNAVARFQNNNFDYNKNIKIYFPQASVRVKGIGFIFTR